jgi:hypothetical protein
MKKILTILLIFISLNSFSQKTFNEFYNDNRDKINHFTAGYIIGYAGNVSIYEITKNKHIAFVSGIGLSILAGHLKEVYDSKHGGIYNKNDFIATSSGGIVGSFTIRIIIGKSKHRKLVTMQEWYDYENQ